MRDFSSSSTNGWVESVLIGSGAGIAFLALYLTTGIAVAQWNVSEFFAHLTGETIIWLLVASLFVIVAFAIPIVLCLQYRLVAPLVLLTIILLGWIVAGMVTGALFGLSLYVFGAAPGYIVLYLAFGGLESYLRN